MALFKQKSRGYFSRASLLRNRPPHQTFHGKGSGGRHGGCAFHEVPSPTYTTQRLVLFGKKDSVDKGLPFGLTRFLSWISLILILASSVMLAFFIGNSARNTLLLRQQQYAMLMASNLNQQIYRRFTLPTFLAFGRIALRQSMQYQQLDDVVQSTILGLHLESLRIYGADRVVNYSINQMELGRTDITPASMERVMSSGIPFFETLSSVNMLSATRCGPCSP